MAIKLSLVNSFVYNSDDGITFDAKTGNIFAIANYRFSNDPPIIRWQVTQFSPSGVNLSSFGSSEVFNLLPNGLGISSLPNGNLLVVSPRAGRIAEFTTSGQLAPGGINFVSEGVLKIPTAQDPVTRVATDLVYDSKTNTIFAADFANDAINQMDTTGKVLNVIDIGKAIPEVEAQGITIDPGTGNFLIADDEPGNNSIHEVTPSGQLVTTIDVFALTGITDPEGLAIDANTRTLYVAFDDDDSNGTTVEDARGNRIAVFKLENDTSAPDQRTNDMRMGDGADNTLQGGFGTDTMFGGLGNDNLSGGFDDDIINGNAGNDTLSCGQGNDLARGGQDNDLINGASGNDTLFGDVGNDTVLGGAGNDVINGGAGSDNLYGREGDDLIQGGDNNDLLAGDAGNDTLLGNAGDDILKGDDGNDLINGNEGSDNLNGNAGNDTLNGGTGDDNIRGGRNDDLLSGDAGVDYLLGDLGNDTLIGGEGSDFLAGGAGNDSLTGGAGVDSFVLLSGNGTDTITDFAIGQDLIEITGGLNFGQLSITQGTGAQAQEAIVRIAATGETLAFLTGVSASALTASSFVSV